MRQVRNYAAYLLLLVVLSLLTPTTTADTAPLEKAPVIDISAQLQQQQSQSSDDTALSSTSASARRLRAMTHHNIGVGSINGQPIMVVEDVNDEVIEHELHDYGHVHKTAHLHRNADGSQFLHVQTLDHDTIHAAQHQQQQQQPPPLPHALHNINQQVQQNLPDLTAERQKLQALQQQHSDQIINQVIEDENDIIVHGGHTHRRSDVNRHSTMILVVLLITFAVSQVGIYFWKQQHEKSYTIAAVGGCWLVPVLYTIYHHLHNHHFVGIWSIYTALTAYCVYATRLNRHTPLSKYTPRVVYGFVFVVFHVCYGLTLIGLLSILADLFGLTYAISMWTGLNVFPLFTYTIYPLMYGLYFGVLNRGLCRATHKPVSSQHWLHVQQTQQGTATSVTDESVCTVRWPII